MMLFPPELDVNDCGEFERARGQGPGRTIATVTLFCGWRATASRARVKTQSRDAPVTATQRTTATRGYCSLMGQGRKPLPDVDAFGCLCSLRARSALDGVSWVQGGKVESAVG